MKAIQKVLSLFAVLSVLLVGAFSVGASSSGTISVGNATPGQTYIIYRLFDLESYDEANNCYSYKVAPKWQAFFSAENNTGALEYFSIDDIGYVTWDQTNETAERAAAFAKLANNYAKTHSIANDGQKQAADGTACFESLPLGYYLIDTTMGSLCALTTTNPTAVVQEKNVAPTVGKLVKEGPQYKASNDASIGDTVNFQTVITAWQGAENYCLHDQMGNGFRWNHAVQVTLNDEPVSPLLYWLRTCNTNPACCEGCTFDVVFSDSFCSSLKDNDQIVVSYSAYLDSCAVVGGEGNKNKSWLTYGNGNATTSSTTTTFTWKTSVLKYCLKTVGESTQEKPLANAKFKLLKSSVPMSFVRDTENANLYRVCACESCEEAHAHITEITTDQTGSFEIQGLDSGIYELEESAAPAGYNKLDSLVQIVIDSAGKVNATAEEPDGISQVKILNNTGPLLPQTGGVGTTVFYLSGGLFIAGGLILLLALCKKRQTVNK